MLRSFAAASAAVLLLASGAGAEEAIPTAKGTTPPAAPTEPPAPLDPSSGAADLAMQPGPCGTRTVAGADGQPHADQSPHGEVTVGVGNHGYREVGAVVCKPMGDNSALIVSVNAGRVGSRR